MLSPAAPRRSWVAQIMGMPISVLARGPEAHSVEADEAVRALFAALIRVDTTFSTYKPDSVISRIARGETDLASAPADVIEVAERCERAKDLTGGLFDPTTPDGRWDPSGFVKGWAVERAARGLGGVAELDWCVNAGGDVVVASHSGEPFTVGIQDPHDAARVIAAVPCAYGGVATSGTAARGAHLYDPRTGGPATGSASVSVAGPSLEIADVLATAAFVAGDAALALVGTAPGYEALRVHLDGTTSSTPGWAAP